VTDLDTLDYMLNTFDYLRTASDIVTGLPTDDFRLVQRWFWYSLNDYRWNFGGSLFDPRQYPPARTVIGTSFIDYIKNMPANPEFHFNGKPVMHNIPNERSIFLVTFNISNAGSSMRRSPRIWIYSGKLDRTPVATMDVDPVIGCGEIQKEAIFLPFSVASFYLRLDSNADLLPDTGDEVISINFLR
jgi:hypothetical protein